jgi:hypothetical protein
MNGFAWDRRAARLRRIVKVEGRTIEARDVSAAARKRDTGPDEKQSRHGLEARPSAPVNAKTTHHGTHLYSHHPLTFNRLMAGKRPRTVLPDAPSCVPMPLARAPLASGMEGRRKKLRMKPPHGIAP